MKILGPILNDENKYIWSQNEISITGHFMSTV